MVRALRVLLAAAALAGILAPISSSSTSLTPQPRVIFITMFGSGNVVSAPHGINCPKTCRSRAFHDDQNVRLVAKPATGWVFKQWGGTWCTGGKSTCAMTLTDTHDCARGDCPIGAFGVRVTFVRADGSS
jgi:hypothetical protein